MPADKGVYNARWEKSFDRILTPLEEFIQRQTTSSILLMICMVIALVIANGPLHEQYEHSSAYCRWVSAWAALSSQCRCTTGSMKPSWRCFSSSWAWN